MDLQQRYEVLRQIVRDYDLMGYINQNRKRYEKELTLKGWQVGYDVALIDSLVNDTPMYPVEYGLMIDRACERLVAVDMLPDEEE